MSSSKKVDLYRDFAAGVYQGFWIGDTVSYVGIFDPALKTVAPPTLSLVQLPPPFPVSKYSIYRQCGWEGVGF
jgi:hypothetical protein